jgi:uncharacterized damage-inducible protein DinB
MNPTATIIDAHAWLRWMTGRSLAACRSLTNEELHRAFPIGLGSVHETLLHLHGAERIWIGVVTGSAAALTMPTAAECPTLDALDAAWSSTRREWDAFLAVLTPEECARVVERVRDGRTYRQTVADACMQVPTHALYHNAQLSFMFRSMGHALPDSSWIIWARERLG